MLGGGNSLNKFLKTCISLVCLGSCEKLEWMEMKCERVLKKRVFYQQFLVRIFTGYV